MKKTVLLIATLLFSGAAIAQGSWFSDLVAQYPLDNNTDDIITTPPPLHGANFGAAATTDRLGVPNRAYKFDGTSGHVISIGLGLAPADKLKSNTMTVSVWVRINDNFSYSTGTQQMTIISAKNPNTGATFFDAYSLYYTKNIKRFTVITNNGPNITNERYITSNTAVDTGKWYHIAMAFNTDSLYLYINGSLQGRVAKGYNMVYDNRPVFIGRTGVSSSDCYLNGNVDALRFYSKVLSPCEVFTLYSVEKNTHEVGAVMPANLCLTLQTDTSLNRSLCAGTSISVPFRSGNTFYPGNVFKAELSAANGSFAAPVTIGTLYSIAGVDTIAATIPPGTLPGTHYRIRVVSSNTLITGADNGSDISVNIRPPQPGPVSGDTMVCTGSAQTYAVTPVTGATTYTWTLPPAWTGTSNTPVINTVAGASGGTISVTATNACGTSGAGTLQVTAGTNIFIPSVTIAAGAFCTGKPAVFNAIPVNGGTAPVYEWIKNGSTVGGNAPTYSDSLPRNGDVVTLKMQSSSPCAPPGIVSSNSITVTISPYVIPGININSQPPGTLCAGTPTLFFANITGGGATPRYQWYKNSVLIAGAGTVTYLDSTLRNGDTVQAVLISSAGCPATPVTYSNKMGVTVYPVVVPSAVITASPGTTVTAGQAVTFTAVVASGGTTPTFQWVRNNTWISGANGPAYTTGTLHSGDVIWVEMNSQAYCARPAVVSSNKLTITTQLGISTMPDEAVTMTVYPNPSSGNFTISMKHDPVRNKAVEIDIINLTGQVLYHRSVTPNSREWQADIAAGGFASGIYILKVTAADMGAQIKRIHIIK